ncbi:hypothetical protein TWF718_000636 [Orbilia javanica]|uniref:Uncharacterized protein n=1 Tax=Orbilia javanica TaxID=47235 RepID=A0AAN8RRS7_9PEZI
MARTMAPKLFKARKNKRASKAQRGGTITRPKSPTPSNNGQGIPKTNGKKAKKKDIECPNLVLLGFRRKKCFKELYQAFNRYGVTGHGEMLDRMQEQWRECPTHKNSFSMYWYRLRIQQRALFRTLKKARREERMAKAAELQKEDSDNPEESTGDEENQPNTDTESDGPKTPTKALQGPILQFNLNRTYESVEKAWAFENKDKDLKTQRIPKPGFMRPFTQEFSLEELMVLGKGKRKKGKRNRSDVSKEDVDNAIDKLAEVKISDDSPVDGDEGGNHETVTKTD